MVINFCIFLFFEYIFYFVNGLINGILIRVGLVEVLGVLCFGICFFVVVGIFFLCEGVKDSLLDGERYVD